jgi:hypothetical protein
MLAGIFRSDPAKRVSLTSHAVGGTPPKEHVCTFREATSCSSFTCSGNSTAWVKGSNGHPLKGPLSTEWLIKRLSRRERKSFITAGGDKSMWLQPSPCPGTTKLCWGDERGRKMVDQGASGEVRLESGQKALFHQRGDGFVGVRSPGALQGDLFGVGRATSTPLMGGKMTRMAGLPHNSRGN